ncbi:ABC transporter ATP-binding protein [Natronospirillum operosum]|uniref:ABC transporter ATP-binding protein n=1 Tax=Natronospirillum operosum TaxID=2759953 RepID=A0A4Z0WF36_9GAMM|nr:ABC transporter ATP-binding protein [Natronospirillum operosum]TGG93906.1 ABC transporter ATP-binding protein [Natronospirillum operosum]
MTTLLQVDNLQQTFLLQQGLRKVPFEALRGVSFSLQAGRALALVGESGCGKSTTARVITRMHEPTAGRVLLHGQDVTELKSRRALKAYRKSLQMVFQDPFGSLNPTRSVRHHLTRPLRLHQPALKRRQLQQQLEALLELVELGDPGMLDKYPHQMSGGQRQRVNLARALAVEPEVLIADEPTSMLDVSIRMDMLNLFRKLKAERQLGLLYITHDIATAQYVAEDTAVMYAGQIVEYGPTASVIDHPSHDYTRLLLSSVPDPTRSFAELAAEESDFRERADRIRQQSRAAGSDYEKVAEGHYCLRQAVTQQKEALC